MAHHFDPHFATYENATQAQINKGTLPRLATRQHEQPDCTSMPRYWVAEAEVIDRLKRHGWDRRWLFGWRRSVRSTDERTMIDSLLPLSGVGDSFFLLLSGARVSKIVSLAACLSSFVVDYVVRQKVVGANMSYFLVQQFPVLPPAAYDEESTSFTRSRVLELCYTAYDIAPFAVDLADHGPPFWWNEDRRFVMRAELDAKYFHLYGIERDDVDYIMETFPIVKRKDEERYGSYRTKEMILQVYDAMAEAERSGKPYQTILDPPPGQGPRHA